MLKKLLLLCVASVLISCGEDNEREQEIAGIPVEVEISRFDERFAQAEPDSLGSLKRDFPYLFPQEFEDSVWIEKMTDTIQLELEGAVAAEFPDLTATTQELEQLFQHIKYYFPQQEIPKVVTLTSDVDYRNQVVWADSLLLIALDTYLGMDHPLYVGVQDFIRKNFRKEQIVSDAAGAFAETVVPRPNSRSYLNHMIYYGKILYLKDLLIPFKSDAQKLGYLPEEMDWAEAKEDQIWRYFVEKELLYSSDSELLTRFLYPAPFSKFYLELDNEAPARLGQFIGWQIVRQYMEKNDVSLQEMLSRPADQIFNESNYKPKK